MKRLHNCVNGENRLYVLIDKSLDSVYGCVQGGHAVAQWLLDNPQQTWNNEYLIYLRADVEHWKCKLEMMDIHYTEFREPDLNNRTNAIAIYSTDENKNSRLFRNLKLVS